MGRNKSRRPQKIWTAEGRKKGVMELRARRRELRIDTNLSLEEQLKAVNSGPKREGDPIALLIGGEDAPAAYATNSPKVRVLRSIFSALSRELKVSSENFPLVYRPLIEDDGAFSRDKKIHHLFSPWDYQIAGVERAAWFAKAARSQLDDAARKDRAALKKWGPALIYCRRCGDPVIPHGRKEKESCSSDCSRLIAEMLRRVKRKSGGKPINRSIRAPVPLVVTVADEVDAVDLNFFKKDITPKTSGNREAYGKFMLRKKK